MGEILLEAFHGTDKNCAERILKSDFKSKPNKAHWLGNGIYFYLDNSLAQWWTSKPSKTFGAKILNPAIICCKIDVNEDFVIDLRKYEDYEMFIKIYYDHFLPLVISGRIKIKLDDFRHLRCDYCDFFSQKIVCKMIIGNFYLPTQPYLKKEHYREFSNKFKLAYTEVQVCLFDTTCIKNKEIWREA